MVPRAEPNAFKVRWFKGLGPDSIGLILRPKMHPKMRPDGFYTGNAP